MKRSDHLFDRFKIEISVFKGQKTIEKYYYEGLARYLREGQFESFKELFNASIDFDIFLDTKKIPDRFKSISKLLLSCTERISNGYETSALGDQINILRFCNEYNLLEKDLNGREKGSVEKLSKNRFFISNLVDLFGKVSESFITYLRLVFPRDLYDYFVSRPNSYFTNRDKLMYYIKNNFFDHYTIYGLSVRNLGSIKKFIKSFKDYYQFSKNRAENKLNKIRDIKFIEFNISYISD
ncbi:hypothetical protein LCGC14_0667950 [marine sediment metagenome]|uniref:Uncharacterized protein n=1 Tax=marine sediment metagenome TaxID=412755 RepID=A0A0F9QWU6_9ZZZZ